MAANIKQLTDESDEKMYPVTIGEAISMKRSNQSMTLEQFLNAKITFNVKDPSANDGENGDLWFCD